MSNEESKNDVVRAVRELLTTVPKHGEPNHVSNGWLLGYYNGLTIRNVAKFYDRIAMGFYARAPELLSSLCDEVEQLRGRNQIQAESIQGFQQEQSAMREAIDSAIIFVEMRHGDADAVYSPAAATRVKRVADAVLKDLHSAITPKGTD